MKNLKFKFATTLIGVLAITLSGCGTTMQAGRSTYSDDLYATHDRKLIAEKETKKAMIEKAEAEAREAKFLAMIAAADADEAQLELEQRTGNRFQDILADDYESAYERRLRGFESPSYRMPSSYYNYRYGNDSFYASAYDPAFYNVMVMGDQVWVEPKYITSMFGNWGASNVNVNLNFGFGGWWGSPYYYRGYPYSYWNSYWNYPHYGWGGPYWGHNHYWGGGNYYPSNVTHRPSYSTGYKRPSSYTNGYRGNSNKTGSYGGSSGSYRKGSSSRSSGSSSGSYNKDRDTNRGSGTYTGGGNSSNRGGGTYTGGSSSGSSSGSRGGGGSSGGSTGGGSGSRNR